MKAIKRLQKVAKLRKANLELATLPTVLGVLGVTRRRANHSCNRFRGYRVGGATQETLYDMLEEARNNHRELIRKHHPDAGGRHEEATQINVAWRRVKELMARRGVALCGCLCLLFAGCTTSTAGNKHAVAKTHLSSATSMAQTEPENVVAPQLYSCHWPPGDYTNFIVVSATDVAVPVAHWPTWLETQETNFIFAAAEAQRFFAVCGTNLATGENAWAGDQGLPNER